MPSRCPRRFLSLRPHVTAGNTARVAISIILLATLPLSGVRAAEVARSDRLGCTGCGQSGVAPGTQIDGVSASVLRPPAVETAVIVLPSPTFHGPPVGVGGVITEAIEATERTSVGLDLGYARASLRFLADLVTVPREASALPDLATIPLATSYAAE